MNQAVDFSLNEYKKKFPNTSASLTKTRFYFFTIICTLLIFALINIKKFSFAFVFVSNFIFLSNFIFRIFLFFFSKNHTIQEVDFKVEAKDLPLYTILLPVYREKEKTILQLIRSIDALQYPKEKLEVLILLEQEDEFTKLNLQNLPIHYKVIEVPNLAPKTKPKACNYGLYFAKGEFVVIYDAEDVPAKNQLIKVVERFRAASKHTICVQCILNFYNRDKNIISRCFSLEYLMWFNYFLKSISDLNLFIPLGGTSNHFKRRELIEIGGWDAYNLTEDAELGVRIKKSNFTTVLIESFTMEEAPFKIKHFIFQRSRWQKGHLQTFLAHISDFKGNIKFGIMQTFNLFFSIGFSFFIFFFFPLVLFFGFFVQYNLLITSLSALNILCAIIFIFMFKKIEHENRDFLNFKNKKNYIFLPIYFTLHIVSSFIAFVEFFTKTFYWNKTEHNVE